MMNTYTLTLPSAKPPASLYFSAPADQLQPQVDIQEQFFDFIRPMRSSGLFDMKKLFEYELVFKEMEFNSVSKKENNALALGMFLWKVIRPAMALAKTEGDVEKQLEILRFDDDLIKILNLLLQNEGRVAELIAKCKERVGELQANINPEELERARQGLEDCARELSREANRFTQAIREDYERVQNGTINLNEKQIAAAKAMEELFDPLAESLKEAVTEIVAISKAAEKLNVGIQERTVVSKKLEDQCYKLFGGL